MYMVYSFMNNLDAMFPNATNRDSRFSITTRIFYTVVLNALLFGFMIIHLCLQVYHENLPENKPVWHREKELALSEDAEIIYMSHVAGIMLITTVIVPIFNIIVFVLANYYYILELMININLHVVRKDDCRKKIEEHGDVAKGIMGFAGKNVHATPGRLRDIQSLSTFQKIFFVLREWWIDIIFFVWVSIILGYLYLFYEYYTNHVSFSQIDDTITASQLTFSIVYVCSFMICVGLFVLGNYHSFVVVIVTVIIALPLFLSFAIQALMDKCGEVAGKTVTREKDKFAGIVSLVGKKNDKSPMPTPVLIKPATDSSPPTAYPDTRPPTEYPDGRPLTAYPNTRPQTVYSKGMPETVYSDGQPRTVYSTGQPQTVYSSGRPETVYSDGRLPSARPVTGRVSYVPLSGNKSPLLTKASARLRGERVNSSASSVVISMTNVEEPEPDNFN